MRMTDFTPEQVLAWMDESFVVDPVSGTLTWKLPPKNHPRMMGRQAGTSRPTHSAKQYVHVKMDRAPMKRSWLIFLWVHRRWPAECIDHIDGNSLNDSISNLREATITQNAWNHQKRARRINLPMGVRRIAQSGRYQARISHHGKQIHLGAYDTPDEAHAVYRAKRVELYGQFA